MKTIKRNKYPTDTHKTFSEVDSSGLCLPEILLMMNLQNPTDTFKYLERLVNLVALSKRSFMEHNVPYNYCVIIEPKTKIVLKAGVRDPAEADN